MYSPWQLTKKYLDYYRHADNSKGHGVHSPFVFEFITQVKNKKETSPLTSLIEQYRKQLLTDNRIISVNDFGAGSHYTQGKEKRVKNIAAASPKNKKFAQLLYRIAQHYHCRNIVELGTSFGITAAYLASAENARLITVEGSESIAAIAQDFFDKSGLSGIHLIKNNFDAALPEILDSMDKIDLLFVDGNHREEPTVRYFQQFLPKAHNNSIFIFDDIHWSAEMERAWKFISEHKSVTLTIDLFFIGLVFFEKEFLIKQDFSIRF